MKKNRKKSLSKKSVFFGAFFLSLMIFCSLVKADDNYDGEVDKVRFFIPPEYNVKQGDMGDPNSILEDPETTDEENNFEIDPVDESQTYDGYEEQEEEIPQQMISHEFTSDDPPINIEQQNYGAFLPPPEKDSKLEDQQSEDEIPQQLISHELDGDKLDGEYNQIGDFNPTIDIDEESLSGVKSEGPPPP